MRKFTLTVVAIMVALVTLTIGSAFAFAEETPAPPAADETQTVKETTDKPLNADEVANLAVEKAIAALDEKDTAHNFNEWVKKNKEMLVSVISGIIGFIALAFIKYLQKSQNAGHLSSIKLFNKMQDESKVIQEACGKIDDNSAEFNSLKETVISQANTIEVLKAEVIKSDNRNANALKNIAEMLYKAYSASNLGENIKDSIVANFNKIVAFDDTEKDKTLEKAKQALSEVITKIDSAKA